MMSRASELIGKDPRFVAAIEAAETAAGLDAPILIYGETGAGKGRFAEYAHKASGRSGRFVSLNCATFQPSLFESELFGYMRGSFTGAVKDSAGLFETASGGTLFLDEIGDTPLEIQPKLLRALEEGVIRRVGGRSEISVDVRLICATNRNLKELIKAGRFREDLYYRINSFVVTIPPLRERPDDIPELAAHFLEELGTRDGKLHTLSTEAADVLRAYRWPGNVRELRNAVQRAFILADEQLQLRSVVSKPMVVSVMSDARALRIPVGTALAEAERWMIVATLKECGGNKTRAAALLGVSLKTLYNRLNEYRALGLDTTDLTGDVVEASA